MNAPAPAVMPAQAGIQLPAAASIADLVARARVALDDGDFQAALLLSGKAYDDAKIGAKFAAQAGERVAAAEGLIRKAHALQGDALLIEARAKMRLADEWDAAQARGEASKGRPKSLPDGKTFTTAEVGLTAKRIHEARQLRDAETASPGLIERAIQQRLEAGLAPGRANLRAAIGTDTATKAERGDNLYQTPPEAVAALLGLEDFDGPVWEPACGKGAISKLLEAAGHDVILSDLVDYGTTDRNGELAWVEDFLATDRAWTDKHAPGWGAGSTSSPLGGDLVTNPPFGECLNAFVAHALRVHRPRKMALLLNLNFVCGTDDADRNYVLDELMPSRVFVFTRRLPMMHRDGWAGPETSSRMNTAWFVWERRGASYAHSTELIRCDWKAFGEIAQSGQERPLHTTTPAGSGADKIPATDPWDGVGDLPKFVKRKRRAA